MNVCRGESSFGNVRPGVDREDRMVAYNAAALMEKVAFISVDAVETCGDKS